MNDRQEPRTDRLKETTRRVNGNHKGNDILYLATWNVRTLAKKGALADLKEQLDKYKIMIAALQEMRWKGNGIFVSGRHTIFYSGRDRGGERGTGFVVNNQIKGSILKFDPVNDKISPLRIKARFFNITLINAYAPTEEAEEANKDEFYDKLVEVYDSVGRHDVKIVLGDVNAKVGREEALRRTIGRDSLHAECNDNGLRLVDFAESKNMVVKSTWHPRKDIFKGTWTSPNGETTNQIDHVLIDRSHATDIQNVKSCRGADCDSDHYMVKVKYRQKITRTGKIRAKRKDQYDVGKLKKDQQVRESYAGNLSERLEAEDERWRVKSVQEKWDLLRDNMKEVAENILGKKQKERRGEWFDEDCRKVIKERNEARKRMLDRRTRTNVEDFKRKRRTADKECRKKHRMYERKKLEEMEQARNQGEVRAFYGRVKEERRGFQPRVEFIKDKEGNLIGNQEEIILRWTEHFQELLNGDLGENNEEEVEVFRRDVREEEEEEIEGPTREEVKTAIRDLKNNKAPGEDEIPSELWKYGGDILEERMYSLVNEVWQREEMPIDWKTAVICPIHKKGDKTECSNFRGISLLDTGYKIFAKVLARKLYPIAETILGDYQCGFRGNRSTVDQIFSLRQILMKCYEFSVDVHQLYIDFKQAYDSVKRGKLIEALRELGVPKKLTRLVKMTLTETESKVRVDGVLSPAFKIKRGLRQGDVLSTTLFNIALEQVMRQVPGNAGGTLFNRMRQDLAYADDVGMLARTRAALEEGYTNLERASGEMGLRVNTEKTKYLLTTRQPGMRRAPNITLNETTFERQQSFKYLGVLITENNNISEEIKARITAGNKSYFALKKVFKSRIISRNTKIQIYRTIVRPSVLYGAETWTLTIRDEELLRRWERKILRRIFGAVCVEGNWRIRTNRELSELYGHPDLVVEAKRSRLRWAGHLQRLPEERTAKKVFQGRPGGRRQRGRPRMRWVDDLEEDLRRLGVRRWRRVATNREEWRGIVDQAQVLHGL